MEMTKVGTLNIEAHLKSGFKLRIKIPTSASDVEARHRKLMERSKVLASYSDKAVVYNFVHAMIASMHIGETFSLTREKD